MPSYLPETAWLKHGPFAMWLVENLQPETIVELGTHHGYSYFCFCEAVQANSVGTKCWAIDTWTGDEHAGFYGQRVYDSVSSENKRYEEFSTLLRMSFDEAEGRFENNSIDLLHIDGQHFYEDVRHDFETWLPKMRKNGTILFHDTTVRERNFGVWKLWSEIRLEYSSFELDFQHGLGVLLLGDASERNDSYLFDLCRDQKTLELFTAVFY